jgi:DNA-binding NtrC family response regulator
LTAAALDCLTRYSFPGNVRELINICERLIVMSDTEVLDVNDLPQVVVKRSVDGAQRMDIWPEEMTMVQILESVERQVLLESALSRPRQ